MNKMKYWIQQMKQMEIRRQAPEKVNHVKGSEDLEGCGRTPEEHHAEGSGENQNEAYGISEGEELEGQDANIEKQKEDTEGQVEYFEGQGKDTEKIVMIGLFPARCWAGWFSNQNEQRSLALHLFVRVSEATVSDPSRSVIKPILKKTEKLVSTDETKLQKR